MSLVSAFRPSIFVILLKLRLSCWRCTRWSKFSILVMKLLSSLSLVSFSNAPRYWILQMFLKLYETARASRSSVAARFAAMDSSVRPVICGGNQGVSRARTGTRVGDRERDGSGFAHPLTSRPA